MYANLWRDRYSEIRPNRAVKQSNGIIETYGIYLTIKETLNRTITSKTLALIYGLFFIAALIEVGFTQLLINIIQV